MPEAKAAIQAEQSPIAPTKISVRGLWGERLASSSREWMLNVDEDTLLDCFRTKPGVQVFIGEHVGKFTLGVIPTAALLGDSETAKQLKAKIDRLMKGLIAAQEPDGYLGTYLQGNRWMGDWPENPERGQAWDLWVHKYCILALLDYHKATGFEPALKAACRAADCVIANVGLEKHDICQADGHLGLAAGSILEAIVLLYRRTGESRYLDFAKYIVKRWEEAEHPRLMKVLRERGEVCTIGRGKAYEMMSCFVGLLEFARTTGNREYLSMLLDARDRIADSQLYPTGSASVEEYFKLPGRFPEHADIETCVTFTWIQFNLRLFEVTGDRRALELVEQSIWNQLLPAMSPTGETWTYHLPITGPKKFFRKGLQGIAGKSSGSAVTCCHTNGQRGMALVPQYIYSSSANGELSVNLYCDSRATMSLPSGEVEISQASSHNELGKIALTIAPHSSNEFTLSMRCPAWSRRVTIDGRPANPENGILKQTIRGRTSFQLQFEATPRVLLCGGEARGKCAIACGPIVMALDQIPGTHLDQVALVLGSGDPTHELSMKIEDGWPILETSAVKLPKPCVTVASHGTIQPLGKIKLVPVLFAGLKDNPCLDRALSGDHHNMLNRDNVPNTLFPEYRVALPCFWVPELRR